MLNQKRGQCGVSLRRLPCRFIQQGQAGIVRLALVFEPTPEMPRQFWPCRNEGARGVSCTLRKASTQKKDEVVPGKRPKNASTIVVLDDGGHWRALASRIRCLTAQ